MVDPAAALLATPIDDPMRATSKAAAATVSGVTITNDITVHPPRPCPFGRSHSCQIRVAPPPCPIPGQNPHNQHESAVHSAHSPYYRLVALRLATVGLRAQSLGRHTDQSQIAIFIGLV
ncbi:Uncharacterised protein [Mycobacterium tuberculosis]|nr:Uncharacterised protein [Mycobacterium tuberculosis]